MEHPYIISKISIFEYRAKICRYRLNTFYSDRNFSFLFLRFFLILSPKFKLHLFSLWNPIPKTVAYIRLCDFGGLSDNYQDHHFILQFILLIYYSYNTKSLHTKMRADLCIWLWAFWIKKTNMFIGFFSSKIFCIYHSFEIF